MPYIEQVTIHNFKSFRHATIKFGKGFNCVVGPNGSGKSTICDSLLFALGESSLKRMRAQSVEDLVNSTNVKKTKSAAKTPVIKAYSSVHIAEIGVDVARAIRGNNKVSYKLNSKRVRRQELVSALKASNSYVTEANTITQDEIGRIMHMSKKEIRSLIDIPAGIKEFEEKKTAALSELSKVEERISTARSILSERAGFLKELKKEKETAERYAFLKDSVKSISYTILLERESRLTAEYEKTVSKVSELEKKVESLREKTIAHDSEISKLSEERIKLSKSLNEHSIEVSRHNRDAESVSKEIAVLDSKIEASRAAYTKSLSQLESLKKELSETVSKKGQQGNLIETIQKNISDLERRLSAAESLSARENVDITKRYEKNRTATADYRKKISELSAEIEEYKLKLGGEEQERAYLNKELGAVNKSIAEATAAYSASSLEERTLAVDKAKKRLSEISGKLQDLLSVKEGTERKIIETREMIAVRGGDLEKTTQLLKSELAGVVGRVYELCSYDEKYAQAVSAACGTRLNYIVVDTIDTASKAISILKKRGIGRASFIPLSDIRSPRAEKGRGTPLISVVSFEKTVQKAMDFVFMNTNIVETIDEAKRSGIGNSRYVTLTGELVEQSGVVSGGRIKVYAPIGHLYLELEKLNVTIARTAEEEADVHERMDKARAELSNAERDQIESQYAAKNAKERLSDSKRRAEALEKQLASLASLSESDSAVLLNKISERDSFADRCAVLETENSSLYSLITSKSVPGGSAMPVKKGEQEDPVKIRDALNQYNLEKASVSKELEMLDGSEARLSKEIRTLVHETSKLSSDIKGMLESRKELGLRRSSIESKIKGFDSESGKRYAELSEIDSRINDAGASKGRMLAMVDEHLRALTELKVTGSQLSTRLADIKAELFEYKDAKKVDGDMQVLEKELAEQKREIESFGNVNMMAPQLYREKGIEVEDAEAKISTLESEKESVLRMISEIESRKLSVFTDTFNSIDRNFRSLYSKLGEPGTAYLVLSDPSSPFESYLSIEVSDGKNKERMERKSGGERSLLIIILVLSILMRNTMSFYIFDEIDASLDKQNSKKLSMLLKGMSDMAQFIVVSHNDIMISGADTIIGVTKGADGSKAVGMNIMEKAIEHI